MMSKETEEVFHSCINCSSTKGYETKDISINRFGDCQIQIEPNLKFKARICKDCKFTYFFAEEI